MDSSSWKGQVARPSLRAVTQYLLWNAEAAERCAHLSPTHHKDRNVRMLFHASSADSAEPGCLLEQVRVKIDAAQECACTLCIHRSIVV